MVNKKRPARYSKAYKQGIESLTDELLMAVQWNRPSLLVAVHSRKTEQGKAMAEIKSRMEQNQLSVRVIEAGEGLDTTLSLVHSPAAEREIVFLSGFANDDVYRVLNLHRETLVEKKMRLVLWLTKAESVALAHHAPDFWAFRHRVVEFAPGRLKKAS